MQFTLLTIFPEFFESALNFSLLKRAKEKELISFNIRNLRDWAKPKMVHKMVDDRPYGGGAGMVMMVEPVYRAINELTVGIRHGVSHTNKSNPKTATIIFSPKGQKYDQTLAEKFATEYEELILISPHYEGFDERILAFVDYELSTGDYVLTGGEIPSLIVIDSVARLLPGVLGNEVSAKEESFSKLKEGERNLEHPQYTRPEVFIDNEGKEHKVPDVLLSGNHKVIEEWRNEMSKTIKNEE